MSNETFGRQLPEMRMRPPGPRSSELAARLAGVESRNVTYLGPDFPVFWSEAKGANVRDADGNVYLDLTGAFGVAVAGHRHPAMVRAVHEQADRLMHGMGDVHPPLPKVDLLEALAALAPWRETRGVLATSGSEAVEVALKTALLATGRPRILAFEGSYHGLTMGALATTSRDHFRAPFRAHLHPEVRFLPFPEDEATADRVLESAFDGAGEVGAVIIEPIQGRGGVRLPAPGFLRKLGREARARGAVLIFDEIFTGLGRTGETFAFEHEGVVPDLLCLGKALGGGLPISACLGDADVMDAWPTSRGEAIHTSTFLGHPLACASALAFLGVLRDEGLAERAREIGSRLRAGLEGRAVRGRGAFLGIVLGEGEGVEVATRGLAEGLLLLPAGARGEVLQLSPPLVLTEAQVDAALEILGGLLGSREGIRV